MSGVVTELAVREGMTVTPGQTLARIASLDPIWIDVQVPEREAALLRPSDRVSVETVALPGQIFEGRTPAPPTPVVDFSDRLEENTVPQD